MLLFSGEKEKNLEGKKELPTKQIIVVIQSSELSKRLLIV